MMVTLSARPIRFHPILWSQNTAARCSASSTLRSRSCGLGSIGRPVTRYPGNLPHPHIVVATSDVQSHAATAPERAFRADGRQRLAKRAQAREGSRCDRLVLFWDCCSAQPPAALAVFGDLVSLHADPRPRPRMRSAARSRRESEDAMTESSADHALARRAILKVAILGLGAGRVSDFTVLAQLSTTGAAQATTVA